MKVKASTRSDVGAGLAPGHLDMGTGRSLREMMRNGADLKPDEAVAIVLQLIGSLRTNPDASPPFGPPSLDNVYIQPDGSVVCDACAVTPAVFEIGILMDAMLPRGTSTKVPGALRYTVARALLEVDAPPFDSVAELSAALMRNLTLPRPTVIERRRHGAMVAELRRQLRQADEELFRMTTEPIQAPERVQVAQPSVAVAFDPLIRRAEPIDTPHPPRRFAAVRWVAGGAVAASIAFGAGYTAVHELNSVDTDALRQHVTELLSRHSASVNDDSRDSTTATAGMNREAVTPVVAAVRNVTPLDSAATRVNKDAVSAASDDSGLPLSPAFASNGTAVFVRTRDSDPPSARESAGARTGDLRVFAILSDGSRNYHVQPSPDGERLAFDSDRDGERAVYVANRDGSDVRRVSGPGYAAVPSWSPDGKRLAFARAETSRPQVWNVWLLDVASGELQRVTSYRFGQTWSASWFADGQRICYAHEDRLIVRDLETGSAREYASPLPSRQLRTPAVSPDGRFIVFQVSNSGAWVLDLSAGSMRCVLTDPTAEEFAWSQDGRRIAFHSKRDGQWGIWVVAPGS